MEKIDNPEYMFVKDYTDKEYIVPLDLKFVAGFPEKPGWYTILINHRADVWLRYFENTLMSRCAYDIKHTTPKDVAELDMTDGFFYYYAPLQWWLPEVQAELYKKYGLTELTDNIPVLNDVFPDYELDAIKRVEPESISAGIGKFFTALSDKLREKCIQLYTKFTARG